MRLTTDATGKPFDPGFRPELSPKRMLRMGIFGGTYFARRPQDWLELPEDWREGVEQLLPFERYNAHLNRFEVRSGQTYEQWLKSGWIHRDDPLGWFQWYCRYYLGRRRPDDARQIRRWRNYRRHVGMLAYLCRRARRPIDDPTFSPALRQGLLHWSYDPLCRSLAKRASGTPRQP